MTDFIRWHQRLSNYLRALEQFNAAIAVAHSRPLSQLEQQGLIQAFEFTHELAWNVMKDYFTFQGNTSITGSRDAIREAFARGIIEDGESWMETISSRNKTTHTYNQAVADEIVSHIINRYDDLFQTFAHRMVAESRYPNCPLSITLMAASTTSAS